MHPNQQTCKVCRRPDKFDFNVPDELWKKIVPEDYTNRVVCLGCFDEFAKQRDLEYAHDIHTLYFAGEQASFIFSVRSATTGISY